ncbi:MAG: hypothetical protein WBC05_14935 [Sedimentisphaerales bacterium]
MAKISKSILVLVVVTLCIVLLAGRSIEPTTEAQAREVKNIDEQQQDVCVLTEAFVVDVNLSELYKQGVSPIAHKPDSVSVENILKCLDAKDIAQVTTGVKVAILSGQRGEAKITETIHVDRQVAVPSGRKVPNAARYVNYNIGKTFRATASVRPSGEILVSFDFSESTYRNITSTDDRPPNTVSREWSGVVNLHAGRPAIAGATQNEDTAVFLVLCADIKGR